jgi:tetratricopeptide (TPR) repeat protein
MAAVLLPYYPALNGAFVYFDRFEIEGNPTVTNAALWLQNFTYAARTALAGRGHYYRPLYFLSYWLLYRIAGAQPFAFHLFQVLLVMLTAWVVFLLGRELLGNDAAALAGSFLWTLHPAHVEAVAWITSLCDVGCALFYLLAFWLFLRAEKTAPQQVSAHFPAAAAFLAALLFKEMAYSFPMLLLAYWFFLAPGEPWRGRGRRSSPYLVVFCGYLLLRNQVLGSLTAGAPPWEISRSLVTQSLVLLGEHTRIFFWPTPLFYGRTTGLQGGSLFPWPAIAVVALVFLFGFRKRAPVLAFLVFFWVVTLSPSLHIGQITFPYAADRFSYLPSVGLCLALSYLLFDLLPRSFPAFRPSRVAVPLTGVIACLWAVQTSRTIPHWRNEDAFSAYSMQESPAVPIFHNVRGRFLATQSGDLEGASREFESAVRLSESAPHVWTAAAHDAFMGLANVALQQDRIEEAARLYENAASRMPANTAAYKQLASLYWKQNQFAKMAAALANVVRLDQWDLESRFNLGLCWLKMGRYSEAAQQFRAVAIANPEFPHIQEAEAQALLGRK